MELKNKRTFNAIFAADEHERLKFVLAWVLGKLLPGQRVLGGKERQGKERKDEVSLKPERGC